MQGFAFTTRRVFVFSIAGFLAWSGTAWAEETSRILNAQDVDTLLRGNTITGTWSGETYTQYFSEDGATVYLQTNRRPEVGRWRVNQGTGEYESWWEQSGWSRYTILETKDGFAWKRSNGSELFTVEQGKQITW